MKKKRIALVILFTVVVLMSIGLLWHSSSVDMLDVEEKEVATIKIQNGNTGKILRVTEKEDISYLIEKWNDTKIKPQNIYLGNTGYSLKITILDEEGNELGGMNNFYINTDEVMRKGLFFYDLESGNFTKDYIEELFYEISE